MRDPRRIRYQRRWLYYLFWVALWLLIAAALVWGFYYAAHPPSTDKTTPITCEAPLDDVCFPDTLSLKNLNTTECFEAHGSVKLHADVICETPLWPSCLDVSGQSCVIPLQQSCLGSTVANWDVTNNLLISGTASCPGGPLDPGCTTPPKASEMVCDTAFPDACVNLPSDIEFTSAIIWNLTAHDFTHVNVIEVNQTDIVTDTIHVNSSLTCSVDNAIDQKCFDLSGKSCSEPVEESCLPPTVTNWNVTNSFILSGSMSCPGGPLEPGCTTPPNASDVVCNVPFPNICLPSDVEFTSATIWNLTVHDLTHVNMTEVNLTSINAETVHVNTALTCGTENIIDPNCYDISGHGVCSSKIDKTCYEIDDDDFAEHIVEYFTNLTTHNITNSVSEYMHTADVDISGVSCTNPINANCVDISGETCIAPLDASCIPVISKDTQEASSTGITSTSSDVYVDVPSLSLIATNSGTGKYLFMVNMEMTQTSSSAKTFVVINVGGVDIVVSQRRSHLETNNANTVSTQTLVNSIANGVTIKVRWKIESNGPASIIVGHRSLIIQQV